MTKKYGSGRDKPPRLRLINDEAEVEKYKRQGWDPRKTYAENMGFEGVFERPGEEFDPSGRYANNGAPSRQEARGESRQERMARDLAAQGRGNDTEIAHLTPGEYVLPPFMQTPEVMAALRQVAAEKNIPFETLIIGNRRNRINPNTGAPEFGLTDGTPEEEGNSQEPGSSFPETQMALNALERAAISPWKSQAKDMLNKLLNNALSSSQVDSLYGQVTKNIPWDDLNQFKGINPNDRPIALTPNQKGILENQINQLQPDDFRQTVRGHLDNAVQNGTITYPTGE